MSMLINLHNRIFNQIICYGEPVFLLFLRCYVGWEFLQSGYKKMMSWDSTLYLFENEYQVPLLNFETAAILGTVAELVLPALLILGLMTRLTAVGLFIFNIVAVISYPILIEKGFEFFQPVLVDGRIYGAIDHQFWGLMLLISIFYGAGKISIDYFICRQCR